MRDKYYIINLKNLDSEKKSQIRNLALISRNSTAFHDLNLNLLISEQFKLETNIILAYRNAILVGFLIYCIDNDIIFSPYQLSLCAYGGPVSPEDSVSCKLIKELKRHCGNNSIYIKCINNISPQIFLSCGFKIKTIPTLIIPLNQSTDEIWKSIDNRIKRNIKKAQHNNILISRDDGQNMDMLAGIYKNVCDRKGLTFHDFDYYRKISNVLNNDVKIRVFYAEYEGKTISAMSVLEYKEIINPWFGGTIDEFMSTGAGSLLYWEIIRYGIQMGFKVYDFLGLDIGPIAFYKKGFGGYESDVYHVTYSPLYKRIKSKLSKYLNDFRLSEIQN